MQYVIRHGLAGAWSVRNGLGGVGSSDIRTRLQRSLHATARVLTPSKEALDTPSARHLSTMNWGLLPGAPVLRWTGLTPAGLTNLAGHNTTASLVRGPAD